MASPPAGITARALDAPTAERDWVGELRSTGPEGNAALADLHGLLLRAARHQVGRLGGLLPGYGATRLDDLAHSAADDALVAVLGKLASFEKRSRFTTWAYKFAIFEAATLVRREAWAGRQVSLDDAEMVVDRRPGPAEEAEATDLAAALERALAEALTPYQRRITRALLLDGVPIDVLAERLGTTRGALYKTLHVARQRLRADLVRTGYLPALAPGVNS